MILVACIIAIAIPLAVMFVFFKLDLYKTGEFRFVLLCLGAGILAYFAASLINPLPRRFGWVDYNQMVRFVAPVVEELLKALIIFILVRRKNFTYFIDGAIYGFATGIGFAVVENLEYIFGNSGAAMAVAINRVISTNLMHAAACAMVGIVLGWARSKKPVLRWSLSLGGLLLAIALHTGFNNLVTRVTSGWLLLYAVIMGAGAAGLIVFMIRRGFREEQAWIQETLGIDERVEKQEMAAVKNIARVDEVLKRIAATFGSETAEKMKRLLIIQAHLGIRKKTGQMMADERMKQDIDEKVDELRQEMGTLRHEIGSYAMAYLRYTHLDEMFSVYGALGTKLQELAAKPQPTGPSLYDRLSQRMVPLTEGKPEKPNGSGPS
jgi:protease PrsW